MYSRFLVFAISAYNYGICKIELSLPLPPPLLCCSILLFGLKQKVVLVFLHFLPPQLPLIYPLCSITLPSLPLLNLSACWLDCVTWCWLCDMMVQFLPFPYFVTLADSLWCYQSSWGWSEPLRLASSGFYSLSGYVPINGTSIVRLWFHITNSLGVQLFSESLPLLISVPCWLYVPPQFCQLVFSLLKI